MAFKEMKLAFQKLLPDEGYVFPVVLVPPPGGRKDASYLANESVQNKAWIESRLTESGAILFRGFEVQTPQDFNGFVEAFGWEDFGYIQAGGLAVRRCVYGKVLTVTETPLEQKIGFHNEAAYLPSPPGRIMFFCEAPAVPGTGGATPIVHGRTVYRRLVAEHKDFVEELRKRNLGFILPGGETFSSGAEAFKADSEGRCYWHNYLGFMLEDETRPVKVRVAYGSGDGESVAREHLDACLKIMEDEKVEFEWERGDVLLIDNFAVQHGRQRCSSLTRNILVSVCK